MIDSDYKFIKKPDFQKLAKVFTEELSAAEKGEKSQLHYIKTYRTKKPIFTSGKFQVVILGGTNYAFYLIEVDEKGEKHHLYQEKGKFPPINSADIFASIFDTHLLQQVDGIAVNLGFPLKYFAGEKGQPDGTFIKATKEHSLMGLLGHKAGEIVLDRYIRKFNSYTTVAVANDIACVTNNDAGLVVGTGYNMGVKGEDENGTYIANLEAGDSTAYESTAELDEIDQRSVNPGTNRFEKLVSGQYLPLHFNILASKEGIPLHISKSEELSEIAATDHDEAGEIARELFDRSAKYVAMHISGLYAFKDKPEHFAIDADGSLYAYGYKYQKNINHGLHEMDIPEHSITFHRTSENSLIGTLKLLC